MAKPGNSKSNSDPRVQPHANNQNQTERPQAVRPARQQLPQTPQNTNRPQQIPPQSQSPNTGAFPQTNYRPQQSTPGATSQQPFPGMGQPSQPMQGYGQPVHSPLPSAEPVLGFGVAPGQRPGDAGPAPVRVPGQASTSQTHSDLTVQTIGSPLQVLEPASALLRFYTRSGGVMALLLFGILGVALPGLILGFQMLAMMDGSLSASSLVRGFLACLFIFWIPLGIIFGNWYLISSKMYLSVHQGGLFLRQAKFFSFNTTEVTIPFNQINTIHLGMVENAGTKISKQFMSKRKFEGIKELASADLNIMMVTGYRVCVPGFAKMFTENSLRKFFQSVKHFMR